MLPKNLEELRQSILQRDLREGGDMKQFRDLFTMMQAIPAAQLMQCAQYIDKNLMIRILRKSGDQDADFQQLKKAVEGLYLAIRLVDKLEFLLTKNQQLQQILEIYQQRCISMELEVQRVHAMEEILSTEAGREFTRILAQRAEKNLNKTPPDSDTGK